MNGMNSKVIGLVALVGAGYVGAHAAPAQAHINIIGTVLDRGGDQKVAPCGDRPRGSRKVYTFEPGATIALEVDEVVPHDSYYRISFDNDGVDGFKDPVSIDPINPNRFGRGKKCEGTAADRCGKSDFCNTISHTGGPTVLWDNVEPHLSSGRQSFKFTVTLPNVECTSCTVQVQQIMEDPAGGFHGPYDGKDDIYYRCIDVVLKKGAGKTPGTVSTPAQNKGIDCLKANPPKADAGVATKRDGGVLSASRVEESDALASIEGDVGEEEPQASEAGGCSLGGTGTAQSAAWVLLALGSMVARARRRRS